MVLPRFRHLALPLLLLAVGPPARPGAGAALVKALREQRHTVVLSHQLQRMPALSLSAWEGYLDLLESRLRLDERLLPPGERAQAAEGFQDGALAWLAFHEDAPGAAATRWSALGGDWRGVPKHLEGRPLAYRMGFMAALETASVLAWQRPTYPQEGWEPRKAEILLPELRAPYSAPPGQPGPERERLLRDQKLEEARWLRLQPRWDLLMGSKSVEYLAAFNAAKRVDPDGRASWFENARRNASDAGVLGLLAGVHARSAFEVLAPGMDIRVQAPVSEALSLPIWRTLGLKVPDSHVMWPFLPGRGRIWRFTTCLPVQSIQAVLLRSQPGSHAQDLQYVRHFLSILEEACRVGYVEEGRASLRGPGIQLHLLRYDGCVIPVVFHPESEEVVVERSCFKRFPNIGTNDVVSMEPSPR